MSTKPDREYTDRSLCNCGYRDPSAVSPQFHGDRCALRIADHREWQRWYNAMTAWEVKAQGDIKAGRLTVEALDFIEDRDAVRYGDMSVRTEYCLALLRKQLDVEDVFFRLYELVCNQPFEYDAEDEAIIERAQEILGLR